VEERVRKTSLNLKWICYWLSKSKKSCRRLLLPAPHVLTVTLLSHRTLKLTSRRRRQRRRVTAAVPPTVTTRMTMMTTTTIKSVIAMKVYDLPNDVSFLLPMMVPPCTQQGGPGPIDLLDIIINVVDGASPWNFTSRQGLLSAGNSSIGAALSVEINPLAPYLNLPMSTCDAIASQLPVAYRAKYGLYFWNTNDPQYWKIVSSASVLSFVFRRSESNDQNVTINIPFTLLNLTIEAPLTSIPTPYFPCNAQSYRKYSLGRTFLQAAFLGVNWNANNNAGV
jgi:hypothetical protein